MARRVNKRFLIILTAVVVGGGAFAFATALVVTKLRRNPERFLAEGKTLMAEGKLTEARPLIARAIQLSTPSAELQVLYGTLLEEMAADERDPSELIMNSRGMYKQAIEIDGRYLPAHRKLLQSLNKEVPANAAVSPRVLTLVTETADGLLALEPNDHEALVAKHSATIRAWLMGVQKEPAEIDAAMTALAAALKANPADPEPVTWITNAYVRRAQDEARVNRSEAERREAIQKQADAVVQVLDAAYKGQESNPLMSLRVAQGLLTVNAIDRDPERSKAYQARAREMLQKAQDLVTPADPNYAEVRLAWGKLLAGDRDLAGAEKVFREVAEKVPHSRQARDLIVQLMVGDPAKRNAALDLLVAPLPADPNATGFDVVAARNAEINALAVATGLRVDMYASTQDATERAKLKGEIEAALAKLNDRAGESPGLLKLKGRFLLVQGQNVEAIQTLNKALNVINQASGEKDYELLSYLGNAYFITKQTGQAKAMLTQVVEKLPGAAQARLLLAQLYLGDNQPNEALAQLDVLDKLTPNSGDVTRMRIQAYVQQGKRDQALPLYAQLPATTKPERLNKMRVALLLGDQPEAVRQLDEAAAAFPGDVEVTLAQAQLYAALKQPDKAKATIDAALAKDPNNATLAAIKARMAAETPEQVLDAQMDLVNQQSDPFTRELQLADIARNRNDLDGAIKHLTAARQIKPDETRLADQFFQVYLQQRKFDEAAKYVPALAKANADQAGGLVYRFRLAFAQGKWADAEALGAEMTSKMSEFAQSWLSYGQALQASGKFADAVDKYTAAIERQTGNLDAYRGLIDSYYALGKPAQAAEAIERALRAAPNDPTFKEAQINHTLNHGNPQAGIEAREAALKADPERPGNWQALATAYMYGARFNAPRVNGEEAANAFLRKARDLMADAIAKWPDERTFAALYADAAVSLRDFAGAEKTLTAFAARDAWKDKAEPQAMLAELYSRMGKPDQAEAAYRLALSRSTDTLELRQRFATFLAAVGKVDGALELLPENDPDATIRRQRINVLSSVGRFKEAEQAVRASLTITPDSLEMQALLASVYLDQRRFEDATQQVKTVLDRDANNQMALYVRGLVKMRQSNPDLEGAIVDLRAVNETNPKNIDVRLALADAYRMRNSPDQAIGVVSSGLQLNPLSKPLRLRLLDLYVSGNRPSDVDRTLRDASFIAPLQGDPEWLAAEANAYAARGSFDKAAERMKAALAIVPDNLNLVNGYINLLLQGRNYRAVITEADKVVAANDAWWAHQFKAMAKSAMNDKPGATADLTAALKSADNAKSADAAAAVINTWANLVGVNEAIAQLKPRLDQGPRWKLQAASMYQRKQDYAAARQSLESAMAGFANASEADQVMMLRFAGSFYLTALPVDTDKALDAYFKLLEKTPNDMAALNNLAVLLGEGVTPPQPERALTFSGKAFDQLQALGRFDPLVYDTHGWTLILAGRTTDGVDVLRTVVNRAPFIDAHYHLAEGYLRLPNPFVEEAQRELKQAADAYDEAVKRKQQVDPAIKAKIDGAIARADAMAKERSGAPAGDPAAAKAN